MTISPLAIVVCGIVLAPEYNLENIFLIAINCCWLMLEMIIAARQEFLNEVPRKAWITLSRILWLLGTVSIFADARWGPVAASVPWTVRIGALVALVTGLVIRTVSYIQLGRYFTYDIRIDRGQQLVTKGIYSVIRHPAYLAICILGSLPGLAAGSLAAFVLMTLCTVPQTVYRMEEEESMLSRMYGQEFDCYRSKSWRLIPFVY